MAADLEWQFWNWEPILVVSPFERVEDDDY